MRSPNPIVKRVEITRKKKNRTFKTEIKNFCEKKGSNCTTDKDYGDSCQKTDLEQADFDFARSEHKDKLRLPPHRALAERTRFLSVLPALARRGRRVSALSVGRGRRAIERHASAAQAPRRRRVLSARPPAPCPSHSLPPSSPARVSH